jgi:hypothetical protein
LEIVLGRPPTDAEENRRSSPPLLEAFKEPTDNVELCLDMLRDDGFFFFLRMMAEAVDPPISLASLCTLTATLMAESETVSETLPRREDRLGNVGLTSLSPPGPIVDIQL